MSREGMNPKNKLKYNKIYKLKIIRPTFKEIIEATIFYLQTKSRSSLAKGERRAQ